MRGGAATFHAALLSRLPAEPGVDVVGVVPTTPLSREIPVPAMVRPDDVNRARFYESVLDELRPDVVLMNHIAHAIGVTHTRLGSPVPALGVIQSWHNITFREGEERRRAVEMTQEALQGLEVMVAPSRHIMGEGLNLGLEYPARVEMIHNPVPALYMEDGIDVCRRPRRGVVYLGSLIPRKEPLALVEAAALLPGVTVSMVGQGELEPELRDRVLALGLEDRVRLAAPPPGDGHLQWVRDALLGAEVMCLPSRSEGLPLAFVEALACGTPIVGFGPVVREIQEEIGFEVGEPLNSADPGEIAAAVAKTLATDWDHTGLRAATLEAFGLNKAADRYLELLSQSAARARA